MAGRYFSIFLVVAKEIFRTEASSLGSIVYGLAVEIYIFYGGSSIPLLICCWLSPQYMVYLGTTFEVCWLAVL